ncbi:unnamed protein product, partial [Iphiclides podalirius]
MSRRLVENGAILFVKKIKAHRIEVNLLQLYEDVRSRRSPFVMNGDGDGAVEYTTKLSPHPRYKRDPNIFVDNEEIGQQPRVVAI